MITNFKYRETQTIFEGFKSLEYPNDIQKTVLRKLLQLHAAVSITDLRILPGNRLEKLVGDSQGQHSIRINDQWQICFFWTAENNAEEVEIVDCHQMLY